MNSDILSLLTGQASMEMAATWGLMKLLHDKRPSWLPEPMLFFVALFIACAVTVISNLIHHKTGIAGFEQGWAPWLSGVLANGIIPWAGSVLGNNGLKQFNEMYAKMFTKGEK